MLHVSDGDAAIELLSHLGIEGSFLSWKDVPTDGPFPIGLSQEELANRRGAYIASMGWASQAEVAADLKSRNAVLRDHKGPITLWFNHELFDQLQLLEILSNLHQRPQVYLINVAGFLHNMEDRIQELYQSGKSQVTRAQYELGAEAWAAFCAPTPQDLVALCARDTSALPFLKAALLRLFQEYPGADGLSRTQRQILLSASKGIELGRDLFVENHRLEEIPFLGDSSFWWRLSALTAGPHPPLAKLDTDQKPANSPYVLTKSGQQILAGKADQIALNGIDTWIGGVHLTTQQPFRSPGTI